MTSTCIASLGPQGGVAGGGLEGPRSSLAGRPQCHWSQMESLRDKRAKANHIPIRVEALEARDAPTVQTNLWFS